MDRGELTIITNMCMIYDGDRILVQERQGSNWPGITFPGGHVKPNESFVDSVIREVYEETGLKISNLKLCGTTQWTQVEGKYRYIVLLYKTNTFSGELKPSTEGKVFWINRKDLDKFELSKGFESMLEIFEKDDLSENYCWYENNEWHCQNK
jgi:8-oxo-dGTP diphosphatase